MTEEAASGKRDGLVGLKENVIMGHLTPAGTGYFSNRIGEMQKVAPEVLPLEPQPEDDAGGATTNGETL